MEEQFEYPDLSVGHVLRRSWGIFRANMGLVFAIAIVQWLVLGISGIVPFLPLVLAGPLAAGANYALVRLVRGQEVEVREIFDGFRQFGRCFGVFFLEGLIVIVGMIALVVPGIILAIGLTPALYLVLDRNYQVRDTLRTSWEMTRGYKWDLLVLFVVVFLLAVLGLLALIVGAIFVGVYGMVVMATAYDELSKRIEA